MDLYSGSLKLLANVHIYGEILHALVKYWDWILPKSTLVHQYIVVTDMYGTSFIIINTYAEPGTSLQTCFGAGLPPRSKK